MGGHPARSGAAGTEAAGGVARGSRPNVVSSPPFARRPRGALHAGCARWPARGPEATYQRVHFQEHLPAHHTGAAIALDNLRDRDGDGGRRMRSPDVGQVRGRSDLRWGAATADVLVVKVEGALPHEPAPGIHRHCAGPYWRCCFTFFLITTRTFLVSCYDFPSFSAKPAAPSPTPERGCPGVQRAES